MKWTVVVAFTFMTLALAGCSERAPESFLPGDAGYGHQEEPDPDTPAIGFKIDDFGLNITVTSVPSADLAWDDVYVTQDQDCVLPDTEFIEVDQVITCSEYHQVFLGWKPTKDVILHGEFSDPNWDYVDLEVASEADRTIRVSGITYRGDGIPPEWKYVDDVNDQCEMPTGDVELSEIIQCQAGHVKLVWTTSGNVILETTFS